MTGTRVTVHRIDADPVDVPEGPAFARLSSHNPSIDAGRWSEILNFLPRERLRTHVALNEDAWPSSSEFLSAVAECQATSALLEIMPSDGWLDSEQQWREAELADKARADDDGPTIFLWRRPLVRLGLHIVIKTKAPLPFDALNRITALLGEVMTLEHSTTSIILIAAGMPQDVDARIKRALKPY